MTDKNIDSDESDLMEYLKILMKPKSILVILFIASVSFAIAMTFITFKLKIYKATSSVRIAVLPTVDLSVEPVLSLADTRRIVSSLGISSVIIEQNVNFIFSNTATDPKQALNTNTNAVESFLKEARDIYQKKYQLIQEQIALYEQAINIAEKDIRIISNILFHRKFRKYIFPVDQLNTCTAQADALRRKVFFLKNGLLVSADFSLLQKPSVMILDRVDRNIIANIIFTGIILGCIFIILRERNTL